MLCTQRDAECDPCPLEHEEADVVDRIDIECDGDEDARSSDKRQHPSAPKGVAQPGRDQQMTDEEQQEAEGEEREVPRNISSESDRDERLHGEETEKQNPDDRDAPSDPADPRADEAPQAPDRDDQGRHSERSKQGPEYVQGGRIGPKASSPACPAKISAPARIAASPVRESDAAIVG